MLVTSALRGNGDGSSQVGLIPRRLDIVLPVRFRAGAWAIWRQINAVRPAFIDTEIHATSGNPDREKVLGSSDANGPRGEPR